jgi:FdhD protein
MADAERSLLGLGPPSSGAAPAGNVALAADAHAPDAAAGSPDERDALGQLARPPETPLVARQIQRVSGTRSAPLERPVIAEVALTVLVDGRELVTMMCTPWKLNCLILGFLYLEGLIDGADDVTAMRVCVADRVADVTLARPIEIPQRRVLTSGCSGGTSFRDYLQEVQRQRVDSSRQVDVSQVYRLMRALHEQSSFYHASRGVHTSALSDGEALLVVAEDVGRHNTLDKIKGECLLRDLSTADHLLISSGRISSEMLLKAAAMRVPIVVSRTSPTAMSVLLAEHLNIMVVGYVRQDSMNVYTHPWRLTERADELSSGAPEPRAAPEPTADQQPRAAPAAGPSSLRADDALPAAGRSSPRASDAPAAAV